MPHARLIVALALLVAPACGGFDDVAKPASPVDDLLAELDAGVVEEKAEIELLEQIGALARSDPESVLPVLIERFRNEPVIPGPWRIEIRIDFSATDLDVQARRALLQSSLEVLARRKKIFLPDQSVTFRNEGVDASGIGRIHMLLEGFSASGEVAESFMEGLAARIARSGTVELLVVVSPPGDADSKSLWPGDRASYDAFIEANQEAIAVARRGGAGDTQSGNDEFRLCVLAPEAPGGQRRQVVLRLSATPETTFRERDMNVSGYLDLDSNHDVLSIHVAPTRWDDFRGWCEANAGRLFAVVVSGVAEVVAPVPPVEGGKVADPLLFDLGDKDRPGAGARTRALLASVFGGTIAFPVSGSVLPRDVGSPNTLFARALVIAGSDEVLEAVQAIAKEDGLIARRAKWVVSEILTIRRDRP